MVEMFLPLGQGAFAQRLQIKVPQTSSQGTYVIYGRLTEDGVAVFEVNHPWTREGADVSGVPAARTPVLERSGAIGTRFALRADEQASCQDSPRVRGMLDIVRSLKGQIAGVTLRYGEGWEPCAKRIMKHLADVPHQVEDAEEGHETGLVLLTRLATTPVKDDAPAVADEGEHAVGSWGGLKLVIDDQVTTPNEDGWFAFLTPLMREHAIVIGRGGKVIFSHSVYPVPLAQSVVRVSGSRWYTERQALLEQPHLDLAVVAVPPVDRDYIIDAGLGLGFGYGREIPGEVKGRRVLSQGGLESRGVFGPVGVKLMGSYTAADESVVPWTATARALGFADRSLLDGRVTLRLGAGVEYFQAEIERVGGSLRTTSDVYIPEQVLAPLTLASVQSVFFDWMVVGLHAYYTPLYVMDVGKFYPSSNVVLEWGVKLPGDWLVTIASGSETHRYPGLERDTRLNIDSSILSVKKGVF